MIDKRRCDGYVDCKDGADERNCSLPHSEFKLFLRREVLVFSILILASYTT